jgi:hypothetical protein
MPRAVWSSRHPLDDLRTMVRSLSAHTRTARMDHPIANRYRLRGMVNCLSAQKRTARTSPTGRPIWDHYLGSQITIATCPLRTPRQHFAHLTGPTRIEAVPDRERRNHPNAGCGSANFSPGSALAMAERGSVFAASQQPRHDLTFTTTPHPSKSSPENPHLCSG